jgi:hypothetical protein
VHFITALRAFGRPSCQLVLHFVWVPLLPTRLALPLVAQPWPVSSCVLLRLFVRLGAHVEKLPYVSLGHPSYELALRCIQAPNLGEGILKNLPPSQNWFLSIIRLVFLPSAPLCGRFRYGSSCFSLRPFMRFFMALRAFGRPSCQLALHCVWVPLLPTRLALPLVRLLVRFVTAFRAFGHPSSELALPCVRASNLGEAILKNLPPSQNCFLSIIRIVFLPSAPFCGCFRCGSLCVSLGPFVHFVTAIRVFGHPSCQLALNCVWVPLLQTRLAFPFVPNLGQAPRVFHYGSSCVWAPMLRTRLALRSSTHLANSPCVAFELPALVRPY